MIVSETSLPSTFARASAALIAVRPSSWAGTLAKAPLKEPTGVRAAETMTTSSMGTSIEQPVADMGSNCRECEHR